MLCQHPPYLYWDLDGGGTPQDRPRFRWLFKGGAGPDLGGGPLPFKVPGGGLSFKVPGQLSHPPPLARDSMGCVRPPPHRRARKPDRGGGTSVPHRGGGMWSRCAYAYTGEDQSSLNRHAKPSTWVLK